MIKQTEALPRLQTKYRDEIIPALLKRFGYTNALAAPKVSKVVLSMGVGKAKETPKRLEDARRDLGLITGQRPVIKNAKKAVSNFRVRIGDPVGLVVTLRKRLMYEFLDRLISVVIPRIKDFRGLSKKSFDGRGSYSIGLSEQVVFPEISLDTLEFVQGMNITIVSTAHTDEEALEMLTLLGMPFAK
jgi:large subunit ribosomal protein L5